MLRKLPVYFALAALLAAVAIPQGQADAGGSGMQGTIPYVEAWPNLPNDLSVRDWKQTAKDYTGLVFDAKAQGENLPLLLRFPIHDSTSGGYSGAGFSIPSYVNPIDRFGGYARTYKIEVSDDGEVWRTVYETKNGHGGVEQLRFPRVKARYVRLNNEELGPGNAYTVNELEVLAPNSTKNMAQGKPVQATSVDAGSSVESAVDGHLNEGWKSQTTDSLLPVTVLDDMSDVNAWNSVTQANVTTDGNVATFTTTDDWGFVSRDITYNLDEYPKLQIKVDSVSEGANWAFKVGDDTEDFYLQGDTNSPGTFTYDVKAATGWSGTKTFHIMVFPVGGNGKHITVNQIRAITAESRSIQDFLSAWVGGNATIEADRTGIAVKNATAASAEASKSLSYNLDQFPYISLQVPALDQDANWALKVRDEAGEHILQGETSQTGRFTYDVKKETGWSGSKTFDVVLAVTGGGGKRANFSEIAVSSLNRQNYNEWITVDLEEPMLINRVNVYWKNPYGEALAALGAIIGGTLAGYDLTSYKGYNWVKMGPMFYVETNGHGFITNNPDRTDSTGSFWYDLYPTLLFSHIGSLYPDNEEYRRIMKNTADSWLAALPILKDNWEHTGFSFAKMAPVDDGHSEPEGGFGIAYVLYEAYLKFGDRKYLDGAKLAMEQMQNYKHNPYYEILGSYGPYLAASMNANLGLSFDIDKFLGYVFTDGKDAARDNWGIMNGRWGDYDAYGLSGSLTDSDGYAFSMNTYETAGAIAPLVRYSPEYSRSIGKYLLHVANNAKLFYPDVLPPGMQNEHDWPERTGITYISYEGLRNSSDTTPYATGDADRPMLNFNPYGAWGSGIMAALFTATNVPEILQIDVLKTDYLAGKTYPTFLYYNPLKESRKVQIDVGSRPVSLYDTVTKTYLANNVKGTTSFTVPAGEAVTIVLVPAGGKTEYEGSRLLVDGVVVDYNARQ